MSCCWQAALLWRCADFFTNGMVEVSAFQELFVNTITSFRENASRSKLRQTLLEMLQTSESAQIVGVSIREFVQHHYEDDPSSLPLHDDRWDLILSFLSMHGSDALRPLQESSEQHETQAYRYNECAGSRAGCDEIHRSPKKQAPQESPPSCRNVVASLPVNVLRKVHFPRLSKNHT